MLFKEKMLPIPSCSAAGRGWEPQLDCTGFGFCILLAVLLESCFTGSALAMALLPSVSKVLFPYVFFFSFYFFAGGVNTNLWAQWDDRGRWTTLTLQLSAARSLFPSHLKAIKGCWKWVGEGWNRGSSNSVLTEKRSASSTSKCSCLWRGPAVCTQPSSWGRAAAEDGLKTKPALIFMCFLSIAKDTLKHSLLLTNILSNS